MRRWRRTASQWMDYSRDTFLQRLQLEILQVLKRLEVLLVEKVVAAQGSFFLLLFLCSSILVSFLVFVAFDFFLPTLM